MSTFYAFLKFKHPQSCQTFIFTTRHKFLLRLTFSGNFREKKALDKRHNLYYIEHIKNDFKRMIIFFQGTLMSIYLKGKNTSENSIVSSLCSQHLNSIELFNLFL